MNNTRRRRINELKTQIDFANNTLKEVSKKLSSILNEEHDAFDNMPEGLQSSYRGMCSEDAINFIAERCNIDKDTIETVLTLEEDYMKSIGIIMEEQSNFEIDGQQREQSK